MQILNENQILCRSHLILYLSGSVFLVNSTDPNKQLPNVKSVFKSLDHSFIMYETYRFITFWGVEILLFIKHCPLKFMSVNT